MHALIIQHEKDTPPGSTIEWLNQRKISYEIKFFIEELAISLENNFDILIICGGSMNVDQENLYPWLKEEKKLISHFIKSQKKIVGLCLGAQLLAELLGARVQPSPHWEVGWQQIEMKDKQFLNVFQWHAYSFGLPPKATLMAFNEACANQAFSYGKNILAFQFHPETTVEWALECAADLNIPKKAKYVQSPEEIKRDIAFQPIMKEWYFSQLDLLLKNSLN